MRRLLFLFAFSAMVILALAPAAVAQQREKEDLFDCSDFATQTGAQALLETGDPDGLDPDGDGKACEPRPDRNAEDGTKLGAKTDGDLDCIDFPTQKAAQSALKANPSDKNKLDVDNDGVACQIVPAPYENPANDKVPVAEAKSNADLSCEDFEYQQEAQMVYFRDESDPNKLDGNDNGLACEESLPGLGSNEAKIQASQEQASAVVSVQPPSGVDPEADRGGFKLPLIIALLAGSSALGLAACWRFWSRTD